MNVFIKSVVGGIILTTFVFNSSAFADRKTVKFEVSKGKKVRINVMYAIDSKSCIADEVPPKPVLVGKAKLGEIGFSSGSTEPHQCKGITINANFTNYTAGEAAGIDKFKIHWKSKNGTIFVRNFIIKVE